MKDNDVGENMTGTGIKLVDLGTEIRVLIAVFLAMTYILHLITMFFGYPVTYSLQNPFNDKTSIRVHRYPRTRKTTD